MTLHLVQILAAALALPGAPPFRLVAEHVAGARHLLDPEQRTAATTVSTATLSAGRTIRAQGDLTFRSIQAKAADGPAEPQRATAWSTGTGPAGTSRSGAELRDAPGVEMASLCSIPQMAELASDSETAPTCG